MNGRGASPLRAIILGGTHVPRMASSPCKETVVSSILIVSTNMRVWRNWSDALVLETSGEKPMSVQITLSAPLFSDSEIASRHFLAVKFYVQVVVGEILNNGM